MLENEVSLMKSVYKHIKTKIFFSYVLNIWRAAFDVKAPITSTSQQKSGIYNFTSSTLSTTLRSIKICFMYIVSDLYVYINVYCKEGRLLHKMENQHITVRNCTCYTKWKILQLFDKILLVISEKYTVSGEKHSLLCLLPLQTYTLSTKHSHWLTQVYI